jgi:hypothetical protein
MFSAEAFGVLVALLTIHTPQRHSLVRRLEPRRAWAFPGCFELLRGYRSFADCVSSSLFHLGAIWCTSEVRSSTLKKSYIVLEA